MKKLKDYIVEYEISHDGHGNYRDDEGNQWTSKTGSAHRTSFGRRHTITSHEPDHPHSVHINGKKWKTFGSASHATNVARKIQGATVHREETACPVCKKDPCECDDSHGFVKEDNEHYHKAEEHLSKANDAEREGRMKDFHAHMADHHDAMSEWHDSKGRSASADKHAEKAEMHHDKSLTVAEGNDYFSRRKREEDIIGGKKPARKKAPAQTSDYQKRRDKMKEEVEAKDAGEYDQEGDMAMTQLRSIIYHAQELHDQLSKNDNLPEWVQSKITLAQDYVQTACDYMYSQKAVKEESINELSSDLLARYKEKAGMAATAADKAGKYDLGHKRFKGIMKATFKQFANDSKK